MSECEIAGMQAQSLYECDRQSGGRSGSGGCDIIAHMMSFPYRTRHSPLQDNRQLAVPPPSYIQNITMNRLPTGANQQKTVCTGCGNVNSRGLTIGL